MKVREFLQGRTILRHDRAPGSPRVSVVMPTYCRNAEGLLGRCVESVLAQTLTDFEFIIVDDGSVDGSQDVIRAQAECDARIVYVRHDENSGLPAVRTNEGILLARAPYVAFMFDDNVWQAGALDRLLAAIESERADVAYSNVRMVEPGGRSFVWGRWPTTLELLQHLNTIPNSTALCRRDFFDRFGLYDPHLILRRCCDWDLWLRALRLGGRFAHVDEVLGTEYGPSSPVSLGRSVNWLLSVTFGYMLDEQRLAERVASLLPSRIPGYDVLDPGCLLHYLRKPSEWDKLEAIVYRPYLDQHPAHAYEPPVPHNRRFDAGFTDHPWTPPHPVLSQRRRFVLVASRCDRLVREWRDALAEHTEAIVLSVADWQASEILPDEVDAVIAFDGTAAFLRGWLQLLRNADVPILYVVAHGRDAVAAADPDPLHALDLNRNEAIQADLHDEVYFALAGVPWSPGQAEKAATVMRLADSLVTLAPVDDAAPAGSGPVVELPFVPNRIASAADPRPAQPAAYLGDAAKLAAETVASLAALVAATADATWTLFITPRATLPEPLAGCRARFRLVHRNDTLPTIAAELDHACLLVPAEILRRHGSFDRSLMEEDLARRGGALGELPSRAAWEPGAAAELLRSLARNAREACVARGALSRADARGLHLTNIVLAALLRHHLARPGEGGGLPPRAVALLNSPILSGSEMVGMLLAPALRKVGLDTSVCVPTDHGYGREATGREVDAWLAERGLPPAIRAPYGMAEQCYELPEAEVRQWAGRFRDWLAGEGFRLIFCCGFICEPLIAAPEGLVYVALMAPWDYRLGHMTFIRNRAAGIWSDSRWAAGLWAQWLAPPVACVPYCVEPRHFTVARPARDSDRVRIAIGGTIQPRKRQIAALQAVARLVAAGYDLEVNLYGYELPILAEYVGAARALAEREPLRGRATFHGFVKLDEVIGANDIVLSASCDESLPQTLSQAMAAGLVAVACPAGGIPELVRDGETGFLAHGFAVGDIVEALERALQLRETWPELIARASELLIEQYSEPVATNHLLELCLRGAEIAASPGARLFRGGDGAPATASPPARDPVEPCRDPLRYLPEPPVLRIGPELQHGPLRYTIVCERDRLCGLQFRVGTFLTVPRGTLRIQLTPRGATGDGRTIEADLRSVGDNGWFSARFTPIPDSKGRRFSVMLSAELHDGRLALYEIPHPDGGRRLAVRRALNRWLPAASSRPCDAFVLLYEDNPRDR